MNPDDNLPGMADLVARREGEITKLLCERDRYRDVARTLYAVLKHHYEHNDEHVESILLDTNWINK